MLVEAGRPTLRHKSFSEMLCAKRTFFCFTFLSANTEKFKCVCQPLGSWNDIISWTPSGDDANTSPPLKEKDAIPLENRPRMMVCHDMAGGYLEDRLA